MNKITTSELLSRGLVANNGKWSYNGKICVIDFYADWCNPCKSQELILNDLKTKFNEIEFFKVNIEEEYELAEIFSIRSLPTIIVFSKEPKTFIGFTTKQKIEEILKSQTILV